MSETWYEADNYGTRFRIKPVEVERSTGKSVWIKGCRQARDSEYISIFPTWQEAKAHLLARAENAVNAARRNLEMRNGELGNVKGLKEPAP